LAKVRSGLVLLLLACLVPGAAQAQQQKKHTVTLKWNAPVAGAGQKVVGYNVYRSDKENGRYVVIARKVSALTYTDTHVQSEHTYYYRVTSMDAKGQESTAVTTKATVP